MMLYIFLVGNYRNHHAIVNQNDRLFVSKYKLNLPSEENLKMLIEQELKGCSYE